MKHDDVPDWVDSAVARDAAYKAARFKFANAIKVLLDRAPDSDGKHALLDAEAACHATIAAATDVAYRLGLRGRSRARGRVR